MRIPTNTRMHRHSKDSRTPPGSSSSHGSSSTGGCGNSGRFLSVPPTTASPTSSSSVSSSSGHSFSSTGISLLREDLCVEEEFAVVKSLSEGGEFSTSKIVLATLKKDATRAKVWIEYDFARILYTILSHFASPRPWLKLDPVSPRVLMISTVK